MSRFKTLFILLIFFGFLFIFVRPTYASTITVNTTSDELNGDGDCSLREAIASANNNVAIDTCVAGQAGSAGFVDQINLSVGAYSISRIEDLTPDDNNEGDFDIFDSLILNGAGSGATTVDGASLNRVIDIHIPNYNNMTVTMQNLKITNGYLSGFDVTTFGGTTATKIEDGGGGVRCGRGGTHYDASVALSSDFYITCNFTNMNITQNTAAGVGGGVLCGGKSDTDFAVNYNTHSGGVTCNFDKVSFYQNTNNDPGFALFSEQMGAGLACVGDSVFTPSSICNLQNVTFSNNGNLTPPNNLTQRGGAILCTGASINMKFSTLYQNKAITAGGIAVWKKYAVSGIPAIDYSTCPITLQGVILENLASGVPPFAYPNCEIGSNITSNDHNLESTNSCNLIGGNDIVSTASGLNPTIYTNYPSSLLTHFPLIGSMTIDNAGAFCPLCIPPINLAQDQRGISRPFDGDFDTIASYDVGAVEVQATDIELSGSVLPAVATLGVDNVTYSLTISNLGLQEARGIKVVSSLPAILNTAPPPVIIPPAGAFCLYSAPTITCEISILASLGSTTMTVVSVPNATGSVNTTFSMTSISFIDGNPLNDTITFISSVVGPSNTPSPTLTPTLTPTSTTTLTPTETPTLTPTPTTSLSPTMTLTPTITNTPTPSLTGAPTNTPSVSPTPPPTSAGSLPVNIGFSLFTVSPSLVNVNDPVTYSFTISNFGLGVAHLVTSTLDLTNLLIYGESITSLPSNCKINGPRRASAKIVECSWGDMGSGATQSFALSSHAWPIAGTINITGQVFQSEYDTDSTNNSRTSSITVVCSNNNKIVGPCTTPTPIPTIFLPSIAPSLTPIPVIPTLSPTPTPTPLPEFFSNWWIVEGAPLHINNPSNPFDLPRGLIKCPGGLEIHIICADAGLLSLGVSPNENPILESNTFTKIPSENKWATENYSLDDVFENSSAKTIYDYMKLQYIASPKIFNNINELLLDDGLKNEQIYFVEPTTPQALSSIPKIEESLTIFIRGDLTISTNPNPNPNKNLLILVDGTLTFDSNLSTNTDDINAVIIAKEVMFSAENTLQKTENKIVINGNFYSFDEVKNYSNRLVQRKGNDSTYPIHLKYNPSAVLNFIDKLSIEPTLDL